MGTGQCHLDSINLDNSSVIFRVTLGDRVEGTFLTVFLRIRNIGRARLHSLRDRCCLNILARINFHLLHNLTKQIVEEVCNNLNGKWMILLLWLRLITRIIIISQQFINKFVLKSCVSCSLCKIVNSALFQQD